MATTWTLPFDEWRQRLSLSSRDQILSLPNISAVEKIIPLRNLLKVTALIAMEKRVLVSLLRQVKSLGGDPVFPNIDSCSVSMVKKDPHELKIGQRYAYRETYGRLIERIEGAFDHFTMPSGFKNLGAFFVFGEDCNQESCLSIYLPPIVEKHGHQSVIMDGIHRNVIAKCSGATINMVVIENISVPFPCSLHDWPEIQYRNLADKPPNLKDRYFDLDQSRFRDLKYLGIDG